MIKKLAIFSLFALLIFVQPSSAFWRNCPGGLPGPNHVTSPNCGETNCVVTRGQFMHADVHIVSPDVHTELMVFGTVFILGIGIQLPQVPPYDNGCNSLFLQNGVQQSCPTTPNTQYIWRVAQEVPQQTPAFSAATVRFEIRDRGTTVGCIELTATVV